MPNLPPGPASEPICPGCKRPVSECQAEDVYEVVDAPGPASVSPADTPAWTPEAALAFIEARPGDKDADAIIRSLASTLLAVNRKPSIEVRHDYVALRNTSDPSLYFRDDEGNYHDQDCRGCEIAVLLAVGERDRRQIAQAEERNKRLTEVAKDAQIVADLNGEMRSTYGRAVKQSEWTNALFVLETAVNAARAVLAGEEDARPDDPLVVAKGQRVEIVGVDDYNGLRGVVVWTERDDVGVWLDSQQMGLPRSFLRSQVVRAAGEGDT